MAFERFGRFDIRDEIGSGGMSRVFRAWDPQFDRVVAIKVLPPENLNDLGFRARFEREAELVAALEHEAIVPVYAYGTHEGQPFIVMQYMPNGSLAERLLRGPFSLQETLDVLARLSKALDFAHSQGFIHRDLKPSNVLFDQDDQAYLADFGIALHSEAAWQRNLTIAGTPSYMSPEQGLRQERITGRSDIYGLGVIAFEMLTGQLPFEGEVPLSIVLKHIHDPPPSPSSLKPELPSSLDLVLHRSLAKDPEERYPSALAFLDAYRHAIQGDQEGSQLSGIQSANVLIDQPAGVVEWPEQEQQPESSNPVSPTHKPKFPELSLPQIGGPAGSAVMNWQGRYVFALGLATWLGVLLAMVTVTFARGADLLLPANIQMVYTDSALAVTNISENSIDLGDVTFERLSEQGEVSAVFHAHEWNRVNLSSAGLSTGLSMGNCVQLLRVESTDLELIPGEAPAKPPNCEISQAWLVAQDDAWHFWTAEDNSSRFRVLLGEREIHTCMIAEGRCDFYLPGDK